MNSVETGIAYTGAPGNCSCCCPPIPPSLWSLLCNQLFGLFTNPLMGPEGTFDEVRIWSEGEITMTVTSSPYTFVMVLTGDAVPKASDVIYFGRKFFIIGAVTLTGTKTYTCTNCLAIDVSIVGVYAALIALQYQVSTAETTRQANEADRVEAEGERVTAETARQGAETERTRVFNESQAERAAAFGLSQQTQQAEFDAAEAARTLRLQEITLTFLTPWVVSGTIGSGNRLFTPTSGSDTASAARTRFYQGNKTYLSVAGYGTEELIADDGECLVTRSGWRWKY